MVSDETVFATHKLSPAVLPLVTRHSFPWADLWFSKHLWLHREGGRGGSYVVLVELLCSYFLVREGGRGATQCWWSYFVATSQLAVCVSRVECCRAVLLLVASWRWVSSISDISGISIISTHLWDIKLQYIDHHTCSSISIGYSMNYSSILFIHRAILGTCDPWSQWWGDMTWLTKYNDNDKEHDKTI